MALIRTTRKFALMITVGAVCIVMVQMVGSSLYHYTSTNSFCLNCHEMTRAYNQWKASSHYNGNSGVVANCIDCHLPQGVIKRIGYKTFFGTKDVYAHFFKDTSRIDWQGKRQHLNTFVFEEGCKRCHANLYPSNLSKGGLRAHMEYEDNITKQKCFDCHEHQNLVHKEEQR